MIKRAALAGLSIFVAWSAIDYVLHGWALKSTYEASAQLWRPESEMSLPLIYVVVTILIVCFVTLYARFVTPKSLVSGLVFGCLYGLATGVGVGFGSYIHMPIPLALAWGWTLGGWIKGTVAGAIVGALVKPRPDPDSR